MQLDSLQQTNLELRAQIAECQRMLHQITGINPVNINNNMDYQMGDGYSSRASSHNYRNHPPQPRLHPYPHPPQACDERKQSMQPIQPMQASQSLQSAQSIQSMSSNNSLPSSESSSTISQSSVAVLGDRSNINNNNFISPSSSTISNFSNYTNHNFNNNINNNNLIDSGQESATNLMFTISDAHSTNVCLSRANSIPPIFPDNDTLFIRQFSSEFDMNQSTMNTHSYHDGQGYMQ